MKLNINKVYIKIIKLEQVEEINIKAKATIQSNNKKVYDKKTEVRKTSTKKVPIPIPTYGCESWTITNKTRNNVNVAEIRYLTQISNKARTDKVGNEEIRRQLNITPLIKKIEV